MANNMCDNCRVLKPIGEMFYHGRNVYCSVCFVHKLLAENKRLEMMMLTMNEVVNAAALSTDERVRNLAQKAQKAIEALKQKRSE